MEAKLLNRNFQVSNLSASFHISEMKDSLIVIDKPKTKSIIIASIVLGLIIGTITVLIRKLIKTRYR